MRFVVMPWLPINKSDVKGFHLVHLADSQTVIEQMLSWQVFFFFCYMI